MSKLVYGVGINDADYVVKPTFNGKQIVCPYYQKWESMFLRCYSAKYQEKRPTYIGCKVSDEWKTFSNFKAWMEPLDWVGKQLDKDILINGNKLYSKDTCVFVTPSVNNFLTDSNANRGECMIGVSWKKHIRKFQSQCADGEGRIIHLGLFDNELEAHLAWKACKHKLACKLADEQSDPRVAEALRSRFAPYTKGETNVS